jgi:hypothetical protein
MCEAECGTPNGSPDFALLHPGDDGAACDGDHAIVDFRPPGDAGVTAITA